MPTFLTDPAPAFYLVLIAFAVVTGMMALRYQDRPRAIRFAIAFGLLLILATIDKTNESPREEAVRRVHQMAQAADAADANRFIEHLADAIEYRAGSPPVVVKKDEVKNSSFWSMLRQFNVHVAVWDFSRDDVKELDVGTIEIGFAAKGETRDDGKPFPLYMRATFKKQPDGQWKLTAIASFKFERHDEALLIPNFPR